MNARQALDYVRASAVALQLPLDDARAERVAGHLQRTSQIAAVLDTVPLTPEDEPAALYCPAPFPEAP